MVQWETLGNGLNGKYAIVTDSAIFVGGEFSNVGGNTGIDYIAKWNGNAWKRWFGIK
ncbi:MAG: hypothetical protein R3C26_05275 [Calditrichia bacterium]